MPLAKKANRIRMRRLRAQQALLGGQGYLWRQLGDLRRLLEARTARVEWQSGGIRVLHERIATLEARLATQPAMVDTASQQRITQLEAEMARLEMMFTREGELT